MKRKSGDVRKKKRLELTIDSIPYDSAKGLAIDSTTKDNGFLEDFECSYVQDGGESGKGKYSLRFMYAMLFLLLIKH